MVASGRNPIIPVIVMDRKADDIALADVITAGGQLSAEQEMFTVTS